MKFLTKEQAEWLIERLRRFNKLGNEIKADRNLPDNFVAFAHIERVINQCTEKEFPVLIQKTTTESFSVQLSFEPEQIFFGHGAMSCNLTFDQFKAFADGCNKIVGYLNETK